MKSLFQTYRLGLFLILCLNAWCLEGQSYKKDSLQIKAYTLIDYHNNDVKDIKLLRVLCDYCTEFQKEAIGEEALRRAYLERYHPENRLKDGKKKLAMYIRISKKDFKALKKENIKH